MTEEEIYGSIGLVIGHEISHAFDTNGAQFDKDGNLSNWWTEEDLRAFQERADRLIAYYDEIIPFSGQTVRGANIRTEAIADMGGFKCMLSIAEQKPDFNYDQFFRQFATISVSYTHLDVYKRQPTKWLRWPILPVPCTRSTASPFPWRISAVTI